MRSMGGRILFCGGLKYGTVNMWETLYGREERELENGSQIQKIRISPRRRESVWDTVH